MQIILLKSIGGIRGKLENDAYYDILDSHGFSVSVLESLTFHCNSDEFVSLGSWRSKFGCIIFTSQRAVEAFEKAGFKGSPSDLCFAVGPATGDLAASIGFEPRGSHCATASSLAEFIVEQYKTGTDIRNHSAVA
uniref:Uroporphyrinogen-III synthase n=1 Tax=Schistocephalus solidus TaxID=70667 RepID=A0A0X3P2L7_SCHSO